jgi:uncharacterized protein YjiS (DUF1127 family)
MSTISVLGQPSGSTRQIPGFIRRCWNALQERRKCAKVRAALYGLNDRDLHDIGIAHGDIEYVASNPDVDPRGV